MHRSEPIRVLQVIENLEIGGAQSVVVMLARHLRDLGAVVVVATLRDGPLRRDLEAQGITVVVIGGRTASIVRPVAFARDIGRIARALRTMIEQHSIDVVQTHLLRSLDFVVAAATGRHRPLVYWTFHNYNFTLRVEHLSSHGWLLRPKRLAHRWLYRFGGRRVAGFIAVSDDVRSSIINRLGPFDGLISVIANGVDVDRYASARPRQAVRGDLGLAEIDWAIVMVGTFKRQKGHAVLLDAAPAVVAAHPQVRFVIVGDGELRDGIESRVAEQGLAESFCFLGSRHDVPDLLAAADCFVLPSLWEGLPMALLEAMAAGLPCVATEVSGTSQVVVEGVTGHVVAPRDSEALAQALIAVAGDPDRARALGAAGSDRVAAEFGGEAHAKRHLDLFRADLAD